VGLLAVPLLASPAAADAPKERVLVGPGAESRTAKSRGKWQVEAGKVGPSRRQLQRGAFWLAAGGSARLADGTVRARFVHGRRLNITLLLLNGAHHGS